MIRRVLALVGLVSFLVLGTGCRLEERYGEVRANYIRARELVVLGCASGVVNPLRCEQSEDLHARLLAFDRVVQAGRVTVDQIRQAIRDLKAGIDLNEAALRGEASVG